MYPRFALNPDNLPYTHTPRKLRRYQKCPVHSVTTSTAVRTPQHSVTSLVGWVALRLIA